MLYKCVPQKVFLVSLIKQLKVILEVHVCTVKLRPRLVPKKVNYVGLTMVYKEHPGWHFIKKVRSNIISWL